MKLQITILAVLTLVSVVANGQTTKAPEIDKNSEITEKHVPTEIAAEKKSPASSPNPTPVDNILPEFEKEVLDEINSFRRSPQEYLKFVEVFLKTHHGSSFVDSEGIELLSFEGTVPVIELIEVLKRTQPLPELKLSVGLIKAATDHVLDLVRNNKTGHRGSDGSLPDLRARRYGLPVTGVNENITYGPQHARDVVLTMLIDDGNPRRSHRQNLLNPNIKVVGLAAGQVEQAGLACVLVLTTSYVEKPM